MRIRNKVAVAVMKLRQTVPMARHRPGQEDQSPPSPITWKDNTTVGPSAHSDKEEDAAGKNFAHTLCSLKIFSGAPEFMRVGFHKYKMPFPGLRTRVRLPDPLQTNLCGDKRI